ncbi:helix-turn-helix domain-containing protein [Arthrobacter sp. SDTb3-6]|uniref:helix-turn-helix domain-containing protein n=1 Tax=Arthrobacter sp. SDTb3-6 TaxID=2713571 RepID=UPI00210D53F1|nr:helix-turn-helix transcriptional regulator [Arthrobacter sp. SDTb3-6]
MVTARRTLHPDAARALGRLLSTQRDKLGKTQQEIADFIGISRGHYRTLERGSDDFGSHRVSNPTIALVIDLAQVLQLDPAVLIEIVLDNHGTMEKRDTIPAPTEPSEHPPR